MTPLDHGAADHYRILQVEPDADAEAIREAYLRMMRQTHPDLHPGDPAAARRAQALNAAYTVLRSPSARARYDRLRSVRQQGHRSPRRHGDHGPHANHGPSPNGASPRPGDVHSPTGVFDPSRDGWTFAPDAGDPFGVQASGAARRAATSRTAYSQDQHDLRAAFHAASMRVGVALFAVGAILLLVLTLR